MGIRQDGYLLLHKDALSVPLALSSTIFLRRSEAWASLFDDFAHLLSLSFSLLLPFTFRPISYTFGLSEMCLQWKDAQCSPYLIDSAGSSNSAGAAAKQAVTLRLAEGRRLECEEGLLVAYLDELTYQTVGAACCTELSRIRCVALRSLSATPCSCATHLIG
jgi:hypothetical protein